MPLTISTLCSTACFSPATESLATCGSAQSPSAAVVPTGVRFRLGTTTKVRGNLPAPCAEERGALKGVSEVSVYRLYLTMTPKI